MWVICGNAANGQECDFCGEGVCDDCAIDLDGLLGDIACSADCVRDIGS